MEPNNNNDDNQNKKSKPSRLVMVLLGIVLAFAVIRMMAFQASSSKVDSEHSHMLASRVVDSHVNVNSDRSSDSTSSSSAASAVVDSKSGQSTAISRTDKTTSSNIIDIPVSFGRGATRIVGDQKTHAYHLTTQRSGVMSEHTAIYFDTEVAAQNAGFHKAAH